MSLSVYLAGLIISTVLALACLLAILIYFPPASSTCLILSLFYLSLFISATGTLTIIGLILRRISHRKVSPNRANLQLWDSFRQGMLLSIILTLALILQSQRALSWWKMLVIVFGVGIIEFWALKR